MILEFLAACALQVALQLVPPPLTLHVASPQFEVFFEGDIETVSSSPELDRFIIQNVAEHVQSAQEHNNDDAFSRKRGSYVQYFFDFFVISKLRKDGSWFSPTCRDIFDADSFGLKINALNFLLAIVVDDEADHRNAGQPGRGLTCIFDGEPKVGNPLSFPIFGLELIETTLNIPAREVGFYLFLSERSGFRNLFPHQTNIPIEEAESDAAYENAEHANSYGKQRPFGHVLLRPKVWYGGIAGGIGWGCFLNALYRAKRNKPAPDGYVLVSLVLGVFGYALAFLDVAFSII